MTNDYTVEEIGGYRIIIPDTARDLIADIVAVPFPEKPRENKWGKRNIEFYEQHVAEKGSRLIYQLQKANPEFGENYGLADALFFGFISGSQGVVEKLRAPAKLPTPIDDARHDLALIQLVKQLLEQEAENQGKNISYVLRKLDKKGIKPAGDKIEALGDDRNFITRDAERKAQREREGKYR